jgi:hypothetical protein
MLFGNSVSKKILGISGDCLFFGLVIYLIVDIFVGTIFDIFLGENPPNTSKKRESNLLFIIYNIKAMKDHRIIRSCSMFFSSYSNNQILYCTAFRGRMALKILSYLQWDCMTTTT